MGGYCSHWAFHFPSLQPCIRDESHNPSSVSTLTFNLPVLFAQKDRFSLRAMIPRFDIFKIYKNGEVLWLGAADEFQEVIRHALKQPVESEIRFCLFDQRTGEVQYYRPADLLPYA
jgi:hypothetical protein